MATGSACLLILLGVLVAPGAAPPTGAQASRPAAVELGGGDLTVEQVVDVARDGAEVKVAAAARGRVARAHQVVLEAAVQNVPVYGLTVGVGLNKDKPVFKQVGGRRVLSEELLDASRAFNLDSLRAHGSGVGEPLPAEVVRASMLIRLNNMLSGGCGAQAEVADTYAQLLNDDVVPVVPSQGTVGEADITLASHIGLVMVGEWEAFHGGRRTSGADALQAAGIEPLRPVGKDFLCIISNNTLVAGDAVLAFHDAEQYLLREVDIFALSLEALNGNVAPFLEATTEVRPFPGMVEAAGRIRAALAGSDLWQASAERKLQDPLSFRDMAYTIGNAIDALADARTVLAVYLNHTEDNPLVSLDSDAERSDSSQLDKYLVKGDVDGAIYPTANFEPIPLVAAVERTSLALARVSGAATMTMLRLVDPEFTHLSRFLAAPGNDGHAFGAIQKTFSAVNAENQALAMPVSLASVAIAGDIEDVATQSQLAVFHLDAIVENLYEIASYQLLHAAQATDLRKDFTLGARTQALHDAYREVVPFVDTDRIFTVDARNGIEFLKAWSGRPPAAGATSQARVGGDPAPFTAASTTREPGDGGLGPALWLASGAGVVLVVGVVAWSVGRRARQP